MSQYDVGDYDLLKSRILSEQCKTCIMRPPSERIGLDNSRITEFIQTARAKGTYVVCHSTFDTTPAICRGFADAYPDTPDLQVIEANWGFVEIPPPDEGNTPQ